MSCGYGARYALSWAERLDEGHCVTCEHEYDVHCAGRVVRGKMVEGREGVVEE